MTNNNEHIMKAKHTPTPWTTIRCEDGMEVLTNDAESICVVKHYGDPYDSKREEANARRIVECVNACEGIADPSAVPELLATLENVMEYFRTHRNSTDAQAKIYGAVYRAHAKATGNTI